MRLRNVQQFRKTRKVTFHGIKALEKHEPALAFMLIEALSERLRIIVFEWYELRSCKAYSFDSRHMHFAVCNGDISATQHPCQRRDCGNVPTSENDSGFGSQETA